MARVLIVGCGCRGRQLAQALKADGHAVRGTSRSAGNLGEIERAGAEGVLADPDRLVTMMPAIEGVTVVCWLMGTAEAAPQLHGDRLGSMLEHIVDTPARGFVYETGGVDRPAATAAVEQARSVYAMPVEVVDADPADHDAWTAAVTAAVQRILSA